MEKRQCSACTKCCEGWLSGEALGHKFYLGKPCHYVTIGKGCNSYALRPKEPCGNYNCQWLINDEIPESFKPDQINAIINYAEINNIPFIRLVEAGEVLSSNLLSWAIKYYLAKGMNLVWSVDGVEYWLGSVEFNQAMALNNS